MEPTYIHLNTRNRVSGTPSNFIYTINPQISPNSEYTDVAIRELNIPKSYYGIEAGRNTFTVYESHFMNLITVTVTPGNYSIDALVVVISDQLNEATEYTSYQVNFDDVTGKIKIDVQGNSMLNTITLSVTNMYEQIGFDENTDYDFTTSITSVNIVNLNPRDCLFIYSDLITTGNGILQKVSVNNFSDYSNIEYYTDNFMLHGNRWSHNGSQFRIWLLDEDGNEINLNGINWTATIVVFKRPADINRTLLQLARAILASTSDDRNPQSSDSRT